jgi:DNA-binding MarR family transcriptional regulator
MPQRQPPPGENVDIDRLAFDLHSAMLHMMRRVRREDDAAGLSAPRMSALSVVYFGGPRTIGEIARMEQVSAPTMTRLVAGLEADGYVRRQPSPDDGRATIILATPKGKRVMEQGRSRRVAFLARQLRALDSDTLAALVTSAGALQGIYEGAR